MTPQNLQDQLNKYLTDLHSIEQQALVQMKLAPRLAGDPQIAEPFASHLSETEEHERLVRERLEARGAHPAKLKDIAGTITGAGFAAFAAAQPDTPGKLVAHAFSYEHMEQAGYRLLGLVATAAGDAETAAVAERIERQEREMGDRLEHLFDQAADVALAKLSPPDLKEQLAKYLADAHAIEAQAVQLLSKGPDIAEEPELAQAFEDHLEETEGHSRLVEERLEALGEAPSRIKDAAMRLGALNWGGFFAAQPDTPGKLCAFAYAFEHLEIAGYELLRRVALRAGDSDTVAAADRILTEERAAAQRLSMLLPRTLDASLHAQGVSAR
jgi:ferritin-like metal-binding protein YciE